MRNLTPALLRRFPLPRPSEEDDKDDRGIALVIGGSVQLPGAILLAGVAALRSGAGKLQIGAPREIAIPLGLAAPEALVASGGAIQQHLKSASAVLVGPGMRPGRATETLARRYARAMDAKATLVLDAAALPAAGARANTVITPHLGEAAALMKCDKEDVVGNEPDVALEAAARFGGVVVLKSHTTYIASGADVYAYDGGTVGLATSGSGDSLAGIVVGLSARGADPLTAALWAVWAHGSAGRRLSRRIGRIGFLARELLDELPRLVGQANPGR
jgi:ADP-dependent NAD(P)H-hydrate dehydratase